MTVTCPDPRWRPWWPDFVAWNHSGRLPAMRPRTLPSAIPQRAWDCYHKLYPPKPRPSAVITEFPRPIAFYLRSDGVGPSEALADLKQNGNGKAIAVDPLAGDFTAWAPIAHRLDLPMYTWTRGTGYTYAKHNAHQAAAKELGAMGTFPNIEDDDLRAQYEAAGGGAAGRTALADFLEYCARPAGGPPVCGVLTNYWTNELFEMAEAAFRSLPCMPEIQPRELVDEPTDVPLFTEQCLSRAHKWFQRVLPLLDGRDQGIASFGVKGSDFGVWPADTVTRWSAWRPA